VTDDWITSRRLAALLASRRDNDVKVNVNGWLVPIRNVHYNAAVDTLVIELVADEDLRVALSPLPKESE
jgi:hypothetical protein